MTFSLLWRYSIQMPDLNATDYEAVRTALLGMRDELRDMLENADENTAPVELDQTQQGRLSRMDAMQQQAMADETKGGGMCVWRRSMRHWRALMMANTAIA